MWQPGFITKRRWYAHVDFPFLYFNWLVLYRKYCITQTFSWDFRPQVCLKPKMNSWNMLMNVSAGGICQLIFCVSSRSPVWQQHTGDSTDARYLTCIMKPGLMQQQLPSVRVVHVVYFIDEPASISCLYFAICCDDNVLCRSQFDHWCFLDRKFPCSRYCVFDLMSSGRSWPDIFIV